MYKPSDDVLKTILDLAISGLNGSTNNAFDKLTQIFVLTEKLIDKKGKKDA